MPRIAVTSPFCLAVLFALWAATCSSPLFAQAPEQADQEIKLGESGLTMQAPDSWKARQPRSRIVQHEWAVPSDNDKVADLRIIMMQSGGGVEANVKRWMGQFTQADGAATADATNRDQREVAGQEVHVVDISGTYADRPRGPMGPKTDRPDYRMLGAIIVTDSGEFYVKMYGNQELMDQADDSFQSFVDSLQAE